MIRRRRSVEGSEWVTASATIVFLNREIPKEE